MDTKKHESTSRVIFFLSPRGTSGERIEERGIFEKEHPLPGPLLHPMKEREWKTLFAFSAFFCGVSVSCPFASIRG